MNQLSAEDVKPLLTGGQEIAFLDIREHGQYGEGHPFFAVNCPYSRLEFIAPTLLPCKAVKLVLLDDGDDVASMAARRLETLGYSDVVALEGGAPAWSAAGFSLFKGVNVPSKAFGEMVEEVAGTPSVSAEDLNRLLEEDANLVVLDGRTPEEFSKMNIPQARSCPNAELGYRIADLAPDPETTIVVNCAGRTRSIIGAQTLRNLGVRNQVFALRNGSQGWRLAGLDLDYGTDPGRFGTPSNTARQLAKQRGERFIASNRIPAVGVDTLRTWRVDEGRTCYLFDIRTCEEFQAGRLPGTIHAPGGQLVQATDQWVAVRGARIVLAGDALRAAVTAYWLRAMGHDAYILSPDAVDYEELESGPAFQVSVDVPDLPTIKAGQIDAMLGGGAELIDLSPGRTFRRGHVDCARWAIRPRLDRLDSLRGADILLTASDPRLAKLAAIDLRERGHRHLFLLEHDAESWEAAGLRLTQTPADPPDEDLIDFLFFVHDRHDGNMEAARRYLEWELGLLRQLDDQERSVLALNPPPEMNAAE